MTEPVRHIVRQFNWLRAGSVYVRAPGERRIVSHMAKAWIHGESCASLFSALSSTTPSQLLDRAIGRSNLVNVTLEEGEQ
jgi:hypothetical protein